MIQLIDQCVISTSKKIYQKAVLRWLLINNETESAKEFFKKINLRHCLTHLSVAWKSLKQ